MKPLRQGPGKKTFFPALVLLWIWCKAWGATFKVYPVSQGNLLQEALQKAHPGDVIEVFPGTYYGNIKIETDNLTLKGHGWPVIQGEKTGNAVTIKSRGVTLTGFIIRGGGFELLKDEAGIKLIKAHGARIVNNRLEDNLHGIYLYQSEKCLISGNVIRGRHYQVQEKRGNGIHLWNSPFNRIEKNDLAFTRDGIYVSFSHYCHIDRNYIHQVRYGIHYMYSNHNFFNGNVLLRNVAGVAMMFGRYFSFARNIVAHNRGFRAYGILWQQALHAECKENLVYDNTIGLYFDDAGFSKIHHNWVINNDIAVVILANSEEDAIYENNFLNNLSLVQLRGGVPQRVHFYKSHRGNYWSNYRGYDLDGDGIGDQSFSLVGIFDDLQADYPEFRFFSFSPLAAALRLAEKALPVLEVPEVAEDLYPLMHPVRISGISPRAITQFEASSAQIRRARLLFLAGCLGGLLFSILILRWLAWESSS